MKVYMDNGSTTMVDPLVVDEMLKFFTEKYGNASSLHSLGVEAKESLEGARKKIASLLNAEKNEIIFTSGGTESNNLAIKGIAFAKKPKGNHIITTKIEHKSVLNTCKWLETQGFEITYLDVDKEGFVRLEDIEKNINEKTILVSIIHGNNEIGSINDIEKIGKLCKKNNIIFHTDACQSFTKTEIDVKKQNLDLVTINSHKIHGPKGVGALYLRKGIVIENLMHGADHEMKKRPGTENISGIVGFAKASELPSNVNKMEKLRDKLIENILKIPKTRLNGPIKNRLCNNINISFREIEGEALLGYLDEKGISSSTGSACSEKTLEPSYVLMALGLEHEDANGTMRLTISKFTTEEEVDYMIKVLPEIVERLRKMSPLGDWNV